jgi:hypothetical protein
MKLLYKFFLSAAILLSLVDHLSGQPATGDGDSGDAPGQLANKEATPWVIKAYHCLNMSNIARINESIIIKIENLDELWHESITKAKKIILYINDHPIWGIEPQQNAYNELKFDLHINDKNKSSWEKILSGNFESSKKIALTVGLESEIPLRTEVKEAKAFELFIASKWTWLTFLAIMIVLLVLLIWGAWRSGLLRETGYPVPAGSKRVFSLGLAQMAFWLYIIVGSFALLFIVMKQIPSFNSSVLILLGISSITAFSSSLINISKIEKAKSYKINLVSEIEMLSDRLVKIDEELSRKDLAKSDRMLLQQERDSKQTKLLELQDTILVKKDGNLHPKSKGFFLDLIQDGGEANLYRLQIIIWTLILGGIFLYKVIKELSMPEYDATLLSLMGISSGTYIGFKLPDKMSL